MVVMRAVASSLSEMDRLFRARRISRRLMFQPKSLSRGWLKSNVSVLPYRGLMVWKLRLESFMFELRDTPTVPPPGMVWLRSTE